MKIIDIRSALAVSAVALNTLNLHAQTFHLLHTFADAFPHQDAPEGGLVLLGDTFYGTTSLGLNPGDGSVFSLNTNGGFQNLRFFSGADGEYPQGALTQSGNMLYGTTSYGGTNGFGTVFSINTSGGGFKEMHAFPAVSKSATLNIDTNAEGIQPQAGLLLSGDTLYGSTLFGGTGGGGTLFAINTNGNYFRILHQFAPATGGLTNLDGMEIRAGLMLSGNTLYGTAGAGGPHHYGTIFSINTDSSGFKVLHSFGTNLDSNGNPLDGGLPEGGLVLSGDTLYGTTALGGIYFGTVYSIQTNGNNFTLLYQFGTLLTNNQPGDGINPIGTLVLSGNKLYGMANGGGDPTSGDGTVYSIETNGGNFTVLHTFGPLVNATNFDGANPPDQLVLSEGVLYGTATAGGAKGGGTVFSLTLPTAQSPPAVSIVPPPPGGATLTIIWPDTAAGFILETNTDLGNAAGWQPFAQTIIDTNGQMTAQIDIAPVSSFFRLHHQ